MGDQERGGVAVATAALLMMLVMVNVGRAQQPPPSHTVRWDVSGVPYADMNVAVNDYVVFQYDINVHNVWKVNASNYATCNPVPVPGTTLGNLGNDNFRIKDKGSHYFICGYRCKDAGMKITVIAN